MAFSLFIFITAAAVLSFSQQAPAGPTVAVEQAVVYASVNGEDLHLDIYHPGGHAVSELRPAIVLLHGGGWTSYDKSNMRLMGEFLGRHGYLAFAVDYRLFHDKESRWPAQLDDVQRSVRWIRANAAKYGVNPKLIGAFGHSAGAQLAALLGMEDTRDNSDPALAQYSSKVQAVVDVSGPTDFTADHDPDGVAFLNKFLGVTFGSRPEVWRLASPTFHVAKDNAAFLIVHGTRDENVPIQQAEKLFERLQAAGVPSSFVKVDDVHTFESPEVRRQLAIESLAFFTRYLGVPPVTR